MSSTPLSARPIVIAISKIAASAAVLLATVGLLWHTTIDSALWAAATPTAPVFPDWLSSVARGWYPAILENAGNLYRRSIFSFTAYLVVCALCVAAHFATPFISNTFLRLLASMSLLGGLSYDLIMFDIGGNIPGLETTDTILSNVRFGFDGTVGAYTTKILRNLCLALAVLFIFLLPPPSLFKWLPATCVLVAVLGVMSILWRTDGYTAAFPSPVTSYVNVYKSIVANEDQPIEDVRYPATPRSQFRKIVLVMDESVRGDYISLNNKGLNTTPFLVSESREIINFGIATSATNCSTASRLAVRFGTQERDLGASWKMLRSRPSIWHYAKLAGFKTVHIDTFGTKLTLLNGMTATERSLIDERIVINDMPVFRRDEAAALVLRDLLQTPEAMFILVDKYGTHIPYDKMYPPSGNVFKASPSTFSLENRSELIKHYKNAIVWSVDGFFANLLKRPLPAETLLLYTSDHGQSLSETSTMISHCSEGIAAVKAEVMVPLFAMTSSEDWSARLAAAAAFNFDRTSHFQIFPTLLLAMGYDRKEMSGLLDESLLDKLASDRRRRFHAGGDQRIYDDR